MSAPLVIAHRGASAEKPENTLAAFRRALSAGADVIELDVQVTSDGVPVVFHDRSLRRLTGVRGRISRRSWPELAALKIRGTESIPRLGDVLRLVRGRAVVQIELKAGSSVAAVVREIRAGRFRRNVILASFVPQLVREAAQIAPEFPRMLIVSSGRPPALARQLAALQAVGVSIDHRRVRDAAWVRYFQDRKFSVWCWTVNEVPAMRRLARLGVDGILSDNPALLRKVV